MVCDDRSDKNPARFYTAKIDLSATGVDSVRFTGVHFLQTPYGANYPGTKENAAATPDPEAMRFNALKKELAWSSEGERLVSGKATILTNPTINTISLAGVFIDSFLLPANLTMSSLEKGPRQNGVFEGLTFTNQYTRLMASIEEPLYDDGPRASLRDTSAYVRLYAFDVDSYKPLAQYAYKLDPVAKLPIPGTAFYINGVTDILEYSKNKILVLERSFSTGVLSNSIRVFLADISRATDVSKSSLAGDNTFRPATKQLLLNMDSLGFNIDNIEGMTLGPLLPNGNRTLLFIADNNFNPVQQSQLLLFELKND